MIRSLRALSIGLAVQSLALAGCLQGSDEPSKGAATPGPTDSLSPSTTPPSVPTVSTDTGDTVDTGTPTTPSGLSYLKLSAGDDLTCALRSDGSIECLGSGQWSLPPAPPGPFTDVAAGWDTACAIRETGEIACWGCDWISSLCDAPGGTDWTAIDTADSVFCAQDSTGHLSCWGVTYGGVPDPTVVFDHFAVGITGYAAVRADNGTVVAAGEGGDLPGAMVEIAAGRGSLCGIRADNGDTACSGLSGPSPPDGLAFLDGFGENMCWVDLAGHTSCSAEPPDAGRDGFDPAVETFAGMTAGKSHACGVTDDGRGFCWPHDGRPATSGISELP